ncbi:uncharacterized protein EV420DRAFT_1492886 [Desarmillaria tabescens]|uniref:Uncharacterized protein n=1 Tax=Armillaria tabescens TaxID=1929756 RepID=A0AA39NPH2_ARMTA|nr:uncharacterized protein EV420DRAFT_1492886 [Desarmillaria tabescens]KAK0469178.1 hypothetical protein EV420DRAFT_1492886 [Desarmillaria tabescens]
MLGPAEVAHGPMFIGFMFNVLLYGIMITQVYLYFTAYKQQACRQAIRPPSFSLRYRKHGFRLCVSL